MKHIPTVVRVFLGLIFFVFGLNGFLNFIPMPAEVPEKMAAVMAGFMASGYLFPLIKGTEVVCGALLLSNRFVPLALAMLAPIVINILAIHLFVDPSGAPMAIAIFLATGYLSFFAQPYASRLRSLFQK